jgi:hypothetical protein
MSEEETRAGADPADQTPPQPVLLPEEIHNPNITEQMLNAQLAECRAMLRDAVWLYRVESVANLSSATISSIRRSA